MKWIDWIYENLEELWDWYSGKWENALEGNPVSLVLKCLFLILLTTICLILFIAIPSSIIALVSPLNLDQATNVWLVIVALFIGAHFLGSWIKSKLEN